MRKIFAIFWPPICQRDTKKLLQNWLGLQFLQLELADSFAAFYYDNAKIDDDHSLIYVYN